MFSTWFVDIRISTCSVYDELNAILLSGIYLEAIQSKFHRVLSRGEIIVNFWDVLSILYSVYS